MLHKESSIRTNSHFDGFSLLGISIVIATLLYASGCFYILLNSPSIYIHAIWIITLFSALFIVIGCTGGLVFGLVEMTIVNLKSHKTPAFPYPLEGAR